VPVHVLTLVTIWNVWKSMRRFKAVSPPYAR
jgi:hypothetical protein